MTSVLRLDASARHDGSASRELTNRLIDRFDGNVTVVERDLSKGVRQLSEQTLAAMWTSPDGRTDAQHRELADADTYIDELIAADAIVIGMPIYNFGPPASLKAWADLVARAGTTFRYTEGGPEGLVPSKPVYVVVASGGLPVGSDMDHATGWLRTFLGFLGLTDVTVIAAEQLNIEPERALDEARRRVDDALVLLPAA